MDAREERADREPGMLPLAAFLMPIHREGWRFVAIFAAVTALLALLWTPFLWIGGLLTLACAAFFRDPPRVPPEEGPDGAAPVVSPADGVVQSVRAVAPPPELDLGDAPLVRVSIFMNVHNVHVNRIPATGVITAVQYRPGSFLNASLDKASVHNERMGLAVETPGGHRIGFVQIAGLVARRIVCFVSTGDGARLGARFGLIRFGSRVDVYLPDGVAPLARVGQIMVAGETVIATLPRGDEPDVETRDDSTDAPAVQPLPDA